MAHGDLVRPFVRRACVALVLAPLLVARADGAGLSIDPSARAAGMGGASTAVFWSGDLDEWANPALLGHGNGLTYRWGRIALIPAVRDGPELRTHRFVFGGGGFGILAGGHTLDYGTIELSNGAGFPIGTYTPTEVVRPLGGGISVSRALRAIAAWQGRAAPGFTRVVDLAFGAVRRRARADLDPFHAGSDAATEAMDLGLVVRLSPLPEGNPGRLSVDVAYGFAALNSDGAGFTFIDAGAVSPSENRQDRHGVAVRAALVPSERSAARLERWFGRRIGEGMRPLAAVALAADIARFEPRSVPGAPLQPAGGSWRDVQAIGLEIELANALALRGGHLDDRSRGVHGWSWGLGVGLPLGRLAGVRYDFASSPVIAGADRWRHHGVSMWLDPVAIARR